MSVCYAVGNAIANAKVRGQVSTLKEVRVPEPSLPAVPTPMDECGLLEWDC